MTQETDQKTLDAQAQNSAPLTQPAETNDNGEKTNGTTKDGSTSDVKTTTSVPQNGQTDVETLDVSDSEIGREADDARTKDEVKFADESNPNQKSRDGGAPGEKYDQDGNLRTGGYSYGVAADDTSNTVVDPQNKGQKPEKEDDVAARLYTQPADGKNFLNTDTNKDEWTLAEQRKLEDQLSSPKDGVSARVTTSAGDYVRVKFFWNNKPLGTYRSRDFKASEAKSFLSDLRKAQNV